MSKSSKKIEEAIANVKSVRLEELERILGQYDGEASTQAAKEKKRPHKKFAKKEIKWEKGALKHVDKDLTKTNKEMDKMMKDGTIKAMPGGL